MTKVEDTKDTYYLKDIYTAVVDNVLTLPTVQRGFVWKPYQIENLWDSLLRGYPIGSIVLTQKTEKNEHTKFEIIDGQQRITTICLGMFNNKNSNAMLNASFNDIRLFIDLAKPDKNDNRKYIFRAITRSHPWGYERANNQKTIESKHRFMLLSEAGIDPNKPHFEGDLGKYYPFDAYNPAPFEFFTNAKNEKDLIRQVEGWQKIWREKIRKYSTNGNGFQGIAIEQKDRLEKGLVRLNRKRQKNDQPELHEFELYKTGEIFEAVKKMKGENSIRIPVLYLQPETIFCDKPEGDESEQLDSDVDAENKNQRLDEIENMFVRLNAGGTPLTGEELNYSILKAHMDTRFQKRLEEECEYLFHPARFITIAYRLFKMHNQKHRNFYRLAIKPRDFQTNIRKEKGNEFVEFLKEILNLNKMHSNKSILDTAREFLVYSKKNRHGLPYLTASRLSDQAPEVIFMLLYRLKDKGDEFKFGSVLHKKALGMITLFSWLGKGEQRDHSQLLRNIFPTMIHLKQKRFWSYETVQRALTPHQNKYVLTPFPFYNELEQKIKILKQRKHGKTNFDGSYINLKYFSKTMFSNRDLVLYAQRSFLYREFKDKWFMLDDTNVPFDWDHIFPQSFIKNKQIPQYLRSWYDTNGNLWACPYSFNRCVHDEVPCKKFANKKGKKYLNGAFIDKSLFKGYQPIKDKFSFKTKYPDVYRLILQRNLMLIREWYDNLLIEKLIPYDNDNVLELSDIKDEGSEPRLDAYLDDEKWKNSHKNEDFENFENCRQLNIDNGLYLYIGYDERLVEKGIEFGLYAEEDHLLSDTKKEIKLRKTEQYIFNIYNYVYTNFTLISDSEESYQSLFNEMMGWLKELPYQNEANKKFRSAAKNIVFKRRR